MAAVWLHLWHTAIQLEHMACKNEIFLILGATPAHIHIVNIFQSLLSSGMVLADCDPLEILTWDILGHLGTINSFSFRPWLHLSSLVYTSTWPTCAQHSSKFWPTMVLPRNESRRLILLLAAFETMHSARDLVKWDLLRHRVTICRIECHNGLDSTAMNSSAQYFFDIFRLHAKEALTGTNTIAAHLCNLQLQHTGATSLQRFTLQLHVSSIGLISHFSLEMPN